MFLLYGLPNVSITRVAKCFVILDMQVEKNGQNFLNTRKHFLKSEREREREREREKEKNNHRRGKGAHAFHNK